MTEPSIEEIQAELHALRQEKERLETLVTETTTKFTEAEKNLASARELNGKLLMSVSSPSNEEPDTAPKDEESYETIMSEVVAEVNKKYMEKMKHDN